VPQPIGSVYLDQPRRTRAQIASKRRIRANVAGHLAAVGIAGLTLAALLIGIRPLVTSPDRAIDAVHGALADPAARAEIEAEIGAGITENLLSPQALETAEAFGIDHEAEIEAWTAAVFDHPDFDMVIANLMAEIHGRVFIEASPRPVDTRPLTDLVVSVAAETAPSLAPLLPPGVEVIHIAGSDLPDLTGPVSMIDRLIFAGLVSGLTIPLAFASHEHRHRVLVWLGRWLLVVGLVSGLAMFALPWFAGGMTGSDTAEAAVRFSSTRLLAPAAIAGLMGASLLAVGTIWRLRDKRSVTKQGAAAWLEVVEPPPMTVASPELELARRGLADGSRHLTNI
jgi:hypothetical protein